MNIPITPHSPGLNDLFFRTADRMRLEGCVNAVAHEGLSLALSCTQEALLDHYVQQLLTQLRQSAPEHRIEVYFPANTESLIARFNDALANQSLREATRNGKAVQSRQIWLVHDAQTLPDHELQLLARLIQNFPGAQISAVLLMIGQAPEQQTLSAFGRKLLRWEIDTPTEEQAQAALELAQMQGQQEAMRLLLRRIGKARPSRAWSDESPQPELASALLAAETAPLAQRSAPATTWLSAVRARLHTARLRLDAWRQRLDAKDAAPEAPTAEPGRWPQALDLWQRHKPLWIAGAGALGLSVLLMMWIQPGAFGLKSRDRVAQRPATEASAAQAVAAQTPLVSVSAGLKSAAIAELPEAALESQAWVRGVPANHFVIQHATQPSFEKAQQLTKSFPALREAQIVPAYRPGEKMAYFAVVSGPYENAGKAYERMARKDMPNTSWVRSVQSLQQQLEPTAKETR